MLYNEIRRKVNRKMISIVQLYGHLEQNSTARLIMLSNVITGSSCNDIIIDVHIIDTIRVANLMPSNRFPLRSISFFNILMASISGRIKFLWHCIWEKLKEKCIHWMVSLYFNILVKKFFRIIKLIVIKSPTGYKNKNWNSVDYKIGFKINERV